MIGHAMLYAIAVGVPILAAATIGARFLRQHGRAERWVWLFALGLAMALPAIVLNRPPAAERTPWIPVLETVAVTLPSAVVISPAAETQSVIGLDAALIGLWFLSSLLLGGRWAASALRLARLSGSWRVATLDGFRVSLTRALGPAVSGVVHPRILVPSWVAKLPQRERALVLLHEWEHIRAGDHWLIALRRGARVLTPWNPLVWMLGSSLGRAIELDCDRRVLRRHPDVATYGATLLSVSFRAAGQPVGAAAFAVSDVPLRRRILAMTTPPRALTLLGVVTTISVAVVLLTGALRVPVPEVRASWDILPSIVATPARVPQQGAYPLPEPKVISDPNRGYVLVFREGWQQSAAPAEYAIVAPDGRWYQLSDERTRGRSVVAYTRSNWGVILPLDPDATAYPADQPIELTRVPQILNPQEIIAAVDRAYPAWLREQGLGATIGVHFLVGADGAVAEARVGQVSAYRDLDEAAMEVARLYRFSPAEASGDPVLVWVSHAIDFRVE